jgi:uncharacterized membrane protein
MPKKPTILIGVLIIAYVAVRFWRFTDSCLWFDEIFSIHAAEFPWSEIVPFIAKDLIHPPLFYFLLKLWIGLFGDGLFWVRFLPVFLSILALYPFWMLCRELKLKRSTLFIAFGLFAANGALIKYAQEVRMYSLLLFLALTSTWLFSRYFFRGKSFWMLVIVNVLLVNTHYFGWFVVVSEVAAIIILQRIKILQTLLMLGVTAAGFVPWIIALFRYSETRSSVSQNIGWMKRPGIAGLLDLGFDLVDPFYFQQSSVDPGANYIIAVPLVTLIFAAFVVFLINFRNDENKDRVLLLGVLALVPAILAFILSWLLPVSIWGSRHLLIVFVPMLLLFAIFLTEIKPVKLSYGLIAAMLLLMITGLVMQFLTESPRHIWCAWEPLANEWALAPQNSSRPKRLYVFEDLVAYHYWFATRSLPNYDVILIKGIEGVPNDPAYFLPRGFGGIATADLSGIEEEELWISFRQPTRPESAGDAYLSGSFGVPVTTLENFGYRVEDVERQVFGRQTAYLIRMTRVDQPNE